MDTDDLSDKPYKAIILQAEDFHHDLTLQFGLLSYDCEDENEFVTKSKRLIKEMLTFSKAKMMDIFFEDVPEKREFHKALNKILDNIASLQYSNSPFSNCRRN